jgi:hypothetical protein
VQKTQGAEGVASGTTVTAANSATSGDAFSVNPTIPTGGTFVYDNAHSAHGAQSFKVATGATAGTSSALQTFTGVATAYFRFYIYATNWTSTQQFGIRLRGLSTQAARVVFDSSGHVQLRNGPSSVTATGSVALSTATWYRVEGFVTQGASGSAVVQVFNLDQQTLLDNLGTVASPLTDNFGTNNIDEFGFGLFASTASVAAYWIDDTVINDTGFPGPVQIWLPQSPRPRPHVTRITRPRNSPVPLTQAAAVPPAYPLPSWRSRLRPARVNRSRTAQIPPHGGGHVPQAPSRARIKVVRPWRSRPTVTVPAPDALPAQVRKARWKAWRPGRGHSTTPVPSPQVVTAPNMVPSTSRSHLHAARHLRPRPTLPPMPQAAPPLGSHLRLKFPRIPRGHGSQPVPAQAPVAPACVPQSWRTRIKAIRAPRGHATLVVPPQAVAPVVPYQAADVRARLRFSRIWRGRSVQPVIAPEYVQAQPQGTKRKPWRWRTRGPISTGWIVGYAPPPPAPGTLTSNVGSAVLSSSTDVAFLTSATTSGKLVSGE